ncbi:MAG TPA: rhodanese-like domain-containing protein [Gaiellaceae bacterium]|nr:rhodanese-like domain-containing protein [Gaiellaceae bacterium]
MTRVRRTLDELLAEAGRSVTRLSPAEALEAAEAGGLIVDIRGERSRERDGVVPGSIHVPRTVLEWRLEPGGAWRNPHVGGLGRRIVVLCDHGCSSLLAAATLAELGYEEVADVAGGFEAWRAAGLPVTPAPRRDGAGLPGMDGPD